MTAPNIAGLTTVTGKVAGLALGTSAADLVANASSSNKVLKINSLIVSNIDGTSSATCDIYIRKNDTTNFYLLKEGIVPATVSLVVLNKETQVYLEENDKIQAQASAAGDLEAIVSYEEIS
tara:strand:+ start:34 stop:396 length:363 start_codon:yes stop_codon:yes gene_type:complete